MGIHPFFLLIWAFPSVMVPVGVLFSMEIYFNKGIMRLEVTWEVNLLTILFLAKPVRNYIPVYWFFAVVDSSCPILSNQ